LFYLLCGLYGGDDFSLNEALAKIKEGLGDKEMVATNTTVFQGKDITLEQLIATCDTIPFLAPKRLVIVEGLLSLFEPIDKGKRPPRPKGSGWITLKEYVARMPESTVLVLVDSDIRKSNPLLKELRQVAKTVEFKPFKWNELQSWIGSRVGRLGGSISPAAVQMLANLIGSNLWVLSSEIEKLCLYTQGRRIEEEDVVALVSEARIFTVFEMVDAILQRRSDVATKLLHRLEEEGAASPYLLAMITRQFRLVVQAKDMLQKGRKVAEIGQILGITTAYDALPKTVAQARSHSMKRLKAIYSKLLETDISIKTGRLRGDKGELALDLLVSELCGEPA